MRTYRGTEVTDVKNVSEFVEKYCRKDRFISNGFTQDEYVRYLSEDYITDGFVSVSRYNSTIGIQVWSDFNKF